MQHSFSDPYTSSYFNLRTALGVIAAAFPLVLVLGGLVTEGQILPSISDYYFSSMRDFVVGALGAIGIFFMGDRGDRGGRLDQNAGRSSLNSLCAGGAAIGLALFPNKPHALGIETFVHAVMDDRICVALHFLSSFVFLTALTVFCLNRFPKGAHLTEARLYHACGWAIVTAGVLASYASFVRAFDWFAARALIENLNVIFWLEAAGIWAFCLAWLVKGAAERQKAEGADQSSRHLAARWAPSQ